MTMNCEHGTRAHANHNMIKHEHVQHQVFMYKLKLTRHRHMDTQLGRGNSKKKLQRPQTTTGHGITSTIQNLK